MKKSLLMLSLVTISTVSAQAQTEKSKNERVMALHQAIEIQKEAFKEAQKIEQQSTPIPATPAAAPQMVTEGSQGLLKKAFDALFGLFQ